MLKVEFPKTYFLRQKVLYVIYIVTSLTKALVTEGREGDRVCFKMAELDVRSVINAINDLVSGIDHIKEPSDIGLLSLRVDCINRMLVTLDVPDDIVNSMSAIYEQLVIIEKQHKTSQYQAPLRKDGGRGRPKFNISQEQLTFLLDQGFSVPEISSVLGVGKRTVERRLSSFGLSVTGKRLTQSY